MAYAVGLRHEISPLARIGGDDAQLQFLIKNVSKLSRAGIIVAIPRQLNDDSRPPDTNEIRYFHDEDKGVVTRVAQKVKDALGVELPIVKREYDGRAGSGYFEIWIAKIP
jgi:recombinational DNA repair protein RecR